MNSTNEKICSLSGTEEYSYEVVKCIADWLLERTTIRPRVGIICGSGLGGMADALESPIPFNYEDIPLFPKSTVPGHKGRLIFGYLNEVPVMCMQGRFHFYEGYPIKKCAMPVRVMKLCGITNLIVSNAAGGINRSFKEGDIMVIKDHINLMGFAGNGPLIGPNDERFGPRFLPLNRAYDFTIRKEAKKLALENGLNVKEGVYSAVGGPTFETVAEIKALAILGVDAIGMSTIHEVLFARHAGMTVFGFSLITNLSVMTYEEDSDEELVEPDHHDILNMAKQNEGKIQEWIRKVVSYMDRMHKDEKVTNDTNINEVEN